MPTVIKRRINNTIFAYFLTFSIFMIPSLIAAHAQPNEITAREGFSTYINEEHNVRIDYPSNWIEQAPISKAYIVSFTAPIHDNNAKSDDSVGDTLTFEDEIILGLAYQNITSPIDSKTHVAQTIEQLNDLIPNFQIVNSSETTLSNLPAYKLTYTAFNPFTNSMIKEMHFYLATNTKTYDIAYAAPSSLYDLYLSEAQKSISSFEITK